MYRLLRFLIEFHDVFNGRILHLREILKLIKIKIRLFKPPIIIVGCGRSGTTLLLSILSAHPDILAIPFETNAFCLRRKEGSFLGIIPLFHIKRIYRYLIKKSNLKSYNRWCEKTPKNVRHIRDILFYFRKYVRIIHIIRDGRDVVTSLHPLNPTDYWVSIKRWKEDTVAGLKYRDHPQVFTIKYENIITDFENSIYKLCNFLKIDYNIFISNWFEYATVRYHNGIHKNGQIKKIYKNSIGKWKKSEHNRIIDELMEDDKAVKLLKLLDYL